MIVDRQGGLVIVDCVLHCTWLHNCTHLSNGSGFSELHVIGACVRRYFFSHQHCLLALLHFLNDLILPFIPEYHAPAVPHNLIIDVEVAVDDQDLKAFRDLLGWIE